MKPGAIPSVFEAYPKYMVKKKSERINERPKRIKVKDPLCLKDSNDLDDAQNLNRATTSTFVQEASPQQNPLSISDANQNLLTSSPETSSARKRKRSLNITALKSKYRNPLECFQKFFDIL